MKYMLDTNICVQIIRYKPPGLLQKLMQHPVSDVGVSSVTVAELHFGVHRSSQPAQNRHALEQFLIPLTVLDFDQDAAMSYGLTRAYLEAQGTPIGSLDTLIAAHALSRNLTLITNNTREFARVPGLMLDDWTAN
jgi:tRNA(fMet)-specific endonuclease VapC